MKTKIKGSEQVMFECQENGKRHLSDFENVEEALQATGGYAVSTYNFNTLRWWRYGQPDPNIFMRDFNVNQF